MAERGGRGKNTEGQRVERHEEWACKIIYYIVQSDNVIK